MPDAHRGQVIDLLAKVRAEVKTLTLGNFSQRIGALDRAFDRIARRVELMEQDVAASKKSLDAHIAKFTAKIAAAEDRAAINQRNLQDRWARREAEVLARLQAGPIISLTGMDNLMDLKFQAMRVMIGGEPVTVLAIVDVASEPDEGTAHDQ